MAKSDDIKKLAEKWHEYAHQQLRENHENIPLREHWSRELEQCHKALGKDKDD